MDIDALLAAARARLDRVTPEEFDEVIAAGAFLVDIRPLEQRQLDGELEGALVVDRNVLEWRLAPSSEWKAVDLETDRRIVIVCNEGYQSSLAAAELQDLGLGAATDLDGGFQALKAYRASRPRVGGG